MSGAPPPNEDIAELVALLGRDSVRQLICTFLREYPILLHQLAVADRKTKHRVAHSLKSNTRVVGARGLSRQMAEIEGRLANENGADLDPTEIAQITRDFDAVVESLRAFAGV